MGTKSGAQNMLAELERQRIAASSVSGQIAQLIPVLKYRQEVARKLDRAGQGASRDELNKLLGHCNEEIKRVIGIPSSID